MCVMGADCLNQQPEQMRQTRSSCAEVVKKRIKMKSFRVYSKPQRRGKPRRLATNSNLLSGLRKEGLQTFALCTLTLSR